MWIHDQAILILDDEGKPKYWQGVLIDITEHQHSQELERDLTLEREAAQRLRVVDEMKNTFLQAVSHDLRTPLAGILGMAVTMARDDLELEQDEMRDLAGRIAQNARKLDRLVTDLLDLDRLSRGIVEPLFRPTDVGALVSQLVSDSELLTRPERRGQHGVDRHRLRHGQGRADRGEPARQRGEAHAADVADLGGRRTVGGRRAHRRRGRRPRRAGGTAREDLRGVPAGRDVVTASVGRRRGAGARGAIRGAARRRSVGRGASGRRGVVPRVPPVAAGGLPT